MARKIRKKPGSGRPLFLAVILIVAVALFGGYKLYYGLFPENIRFNHIVFTKNGVPLKVLQGETVKFHPSDLCKIQEISTNVYFNYGIRLVSTGMDINGLLYEETVLADMLLNKDNFSRHNIAVKIKHEAEVIGEINLIIEPKTEDWIDKAKRSIGSDKRISVLERAMNEDFDDKTIVDMLIEEYLEAELFDRAADLLEKVAAESADQKDMLRLLDIYEAAKNRQKAISVLNRLLKIYPDDIALRSRLAELYENTGKVDEAINEYKKLLPSVSGEDLPWIYKTLGYLYTKKSWPKNAIKSYLKALEMDKDDINLYYNLAELYERTGDRSSADKYLSMAVNMKPDDSESRIKLAESLIKRKQYEEAEKYLDQVFKTDSDSIEALLLAASIDEKKGNKKDLKKKYEKILSIAPNNKTVIFNLGVLEYESGNLNSAENYFNDYIKRSPDDIDSREFLFDIYMKQKDEKSAFRQVDKILNKRPGKKQYYGFIFDYLNKTRNYELMYKIMERGMNSIPGDSEIANYLIFASLNTGRETKAVSLMNGILKKNPDDLSTLKQLAKLYEKLGQLDKALETYKKILDISPENEEAQESYLRLRLDAL